MILIDEEKATKMGGGEVVRILTACAIPPPESAEDAARNLIADIEGDITVMTDYEVVPLLAKHFKSYTEARVADLEDRYADLLCYVTNGKASNIENDLTQMKCLIDDEVQADVDRETAELQAENKRLREGLRFYINNGDTGQRAREALGGD